MQIKMQLLTVGVVGHWFGSLDLTDGVKKCNAHTHLRASELQAGIGMDGVLCWAPAVATAVSPCQLPISN